MIKLLRGTVLAICLSQMLPLGLWAQTTVQIGTGTDFPTSTLYSPVYRFSATSATTGCRSNILFDQAELAAAGIFPGATITKVAFHKVNDANFTTPADYKMYMANTSNTSLPLTTTWASIMSTHTLVYSNASFNIPFNAGWVEWNITPFIYTGGSLEIATEHSMTGNGGATDNFSWEYTNTTPTDKIVAVSSATGTTLSGNVGTYKHRPNIRITLLASTPDDAGVASIDSPTLPTCSGTFPVSVTIQNFGINQINPVDINWSIDGILQTPTTYTSILDTTNGLGSTTASVALGNITISGPTTLKVWTSQPNNTADGQNGNDTVEVILAPSLSGNYTIDPGLAPSPTNFQSISLAADALNTLGQCGPVIFDIDNSTFNENVYLANIAGNSNVNTITFNGSGMGQTVLTHDGSVSNATWQIVGTDHLTIKNMTIANTKSGVDAFGIHLGNASDSVTIDSCAFEMPITTSTDVVGLCASGSLTAVTTTGNNANYLTVRNSTFEGGQNGIHLIGNNTVMAMGNVIENCFFTDHDDEAIGIDDQEDITIKNNTIISSPSANSDGIYSIDINDFIVSGNYIHVSDYGIYLNDANDGFTPSTPSMVVNNMVISDADYGIYLNDFESTQAYHNSVVGSPAFTINDQTDADLRNNIMVGIGDHAFYSFDALTGSDIIDYNLYQSDASDAFDIGPNIYVDLLAWQAAQPAYNANSVEGDPFFLGTTDLHISAGGLAFNNGTNVGIATDIDGDSRPISSTVDIGADEAVVNDYDVVALAAVSPSGFICAGTHNVEISILNNGTLTLTSLNLDIIVNGGTPITIPFTSLSIPFTGVDTLDIGPFLFNANTIYDVQIISSAPNGFADQDPSNDTINITGFQVGLDGTYTIDPSLPAAGSNNYQTFSAAANALALYGQCGPVTFNVSDDVFDENVYMGTITGNSATNTITFNGSGVGQTVLTHDGSLSNATWQIEGTDHLTIKNMTVASTKSGIDAFGLHLSNASDSVTIDSCAFEMPVTSSTDVVGLCASASLTLITSTGNNANYLTVKNSSFTGGQNGIHLIGNNTTMALGNVIENCTFSEHDDEAIGVDDQQEIVIKNNTIISSASVNSDGIYSTDINEFIISGNYIHVSDYGIYLTDANDAFTPSAPSMVVNNMVISDADYGIYLNDFESTKAYHNSVVGSPAFTINDQIDADIRNNIMVGTGDHAFYSFDALTGTDVVDFNIYMSNSVPFDVGPVDYPDLASWQLSEPAFNANSLEGDPTFISATDLHLNGAFAINAGTDVGVLVDIDGDTRPSNLGFDIGADEAIVYEHDIKMVEVLYPVVEGCADTAQYIHVVMQNFGDSTQFNVPMVVEVTGPISSTLNQTVTGAVPAFISDTLILGPMDFSAAGIYDMVIYSNLASDQNHNNDTLFATVDITAGLPAAPTATGDFICASDTGVLTVNNPNTNQEYFWYLNENDFDPIGSGDTLEISGITETSTLYVSAVESTPVQYSLGEPDNSINAGGMFGLSVVYGLYFDVFEDIVIDSVNIYPDGTGDIEVVLRDNGGTIVASTIVTVTTGSATQPVQIPLGFNVSPGTDYFLEAGAATTLAGLYRNNGGAVYPYTIPGIASITGNNFNSSYYYYFYDWKITAPGYGCESYRQPVVLQVDDVADFNLPEDTIICPESILLLDPGTFNVYEWQDNTDGNVFEVTSEGTYSVTATTANNCISSDMVVVEEFPEYSIELGPDQYVCAGIEVSAGLDAGAGFASYIWSDNSTAQTLSITGTGSYSVTVTDANTCSASDTLTIHELELPEANAGPDTLICEGESIVLQTGGNPFQSWSNIAGENISEIFSPGAYFLQVTDNMGCTAMDTLIVESCVLGVESNSLGSNVRIYPNPTTGTLNIAMSNTESKLPSTVEVFDGLGRRILMETLSSRLGQIDLVEFDNGYYFIKISTGDSVSTFRIIKH